MVYAYCVGCLVPYRGVRYHLKEWKGRGEDDGPANKEELFNLRHAMLRNIIERLNAQIKNRYPILRLMSPYSFHLLLLNLEKCRDSNVLH